MLFHEGEVKGRESSSVAQSLLPTPPSCQPITTYAVLMLLVCKLRPLHTPPSCPPITTHTVRLLLKRVHQYRCYHCSNSHNPLPLFLLLQSSSFVLRFLTIRCTPRHPATTHAAPLLLRRVHVTRSASGAAMRAGRRAIVPRPHPRARGRS